MAKILKTIIKVVISVLPIFCMLFLAVSIVCFTVSLNPDVKWNEYNAEVYPGTGIYTLYYNTLWSSLDAQQYEGAKGTGKYQPILKLYRDESWKDSIRLDLMKTLGLTGGALLFLIIALAIHAVTKQKLFVIVTKVFAAASGIAGGYFCMHALSNYQKGIINGILDSAKIPIDQGGYYFPEQEIMKLGYSLSQYGGIITIASSCLVLTNCGLYIPFGDGKWIWQRTTDISPIQNDVDTWNFQQLEKVSKEGNRDIVKKSTGDTNERVKGEVLSGKMKNDGILTVKEIEKSP